MSMKKTLIAVAALVVVAGCNPIGIVTAPIDAAATVTGAVL